MLDAKDIFFVDRSSFANALKGVQILKGVRKVSKYGIFSLIWTEYGKIRTRKNSVFGLFSRSDEGMVHSIFTSPF